MATLGQVSISEPAPPPSHIRTFHPRRGRIGPERARTLADLWPEWGFDIGEPDVDEDLDVDVARAVHLAHAVHAGDTARAADLAGAADTIREADVRREREADLASGIDVARASGPASAANAARDADVPRGGDPVGEIDAAAAPGPTPPPTSDTHTRAFDPAELFGRLPGAPERPLVLEIGCGMGEATVERAAADPGRDYLGVDVHTPGLGNLLSLARDSGLTNVRAARGDAVELLRDLVKPGSVDTIQVFFPDPWPKARHHKRRIIRPDLVALMRERLRPGGVLHCATDWADYAEQMLQVLSADPGLVNTADGFAPRPDWRPVTKFERRARAAGRDVFDLVFTAR